jgi:dTMP kinase
MYKKKPFFIVFEGVEGCGKSYQSKKLKQNLRKKRVNSILTREPGGTRSAESIRSLILKDYFHKKNGEKFDKYTDTLLYLGARNEHIKHVIKPALKKKKLLYVIDLLTQL